MDDFSLISPNLAEYRAIGKVAFVFDNSRNKMTNIYYGTKFKLFGEYYQEFGDGSIVSVNRQFKSNGASKGKGNGENGGSGDNSDNQSAVALFDKL